MRTGRVRRLFMLMVLVACMEPRQAATGGPLAAMADSVEAGMRPASCPDARYTQPGRCFAAGDSVIRLSEDSTGRVLVVSKQWTVPSDSMTTVLRRRAGELRSHFGEPAGCREDAMLPEPRRLAWQRDSVYVVLVPSNAQTVTEVRTLHFDCADYIAL